MTDRRNAPDPITLEIMHNAIRSVTDEMFIALMKSAYSTNIKERHDHSATVLDIDGRLVAQAANSLPIHLASILGLVESLLAKYALEDLRPGDIFIGNDPYVAGGTHLPDINMAMPVFADGKLFCFVCNIAHHADMGGMAPGSMAGAMTEIYQEGLRIPVVRLFDRGELCRDIFDLVLLNARIPDERRGDFYAQIAACRLGERRMGELAETYPPDLLSSAFSEIIERTEHRMRASFSQIPDGVYEFEDLLDDDGLGANDIVMKLRLEVAGERLILDFDGSSPQVKGNINATLNATQSSVCYALKALLDPEVPNNHGVLNSMEILCPEDSVLNCSFPAATAARAHACQRIVDLIIGALKDAVPDLAVGAANGANTTAVFSGIDPRTKERYVYLETLGGGFGGRATKDGTDGVQVHITNSANLPVEAIEMELPLLVEAYELVADSGGAGKHRGGMGMRRAIRPLDHTCTFSGHGERFRHRPWGIFGGNEGATGQFLVVDDGGDRTRLESKPLGTVFTPSQTVVIETPGAGSYGPPSEREPEMLARDYRGDRFSTAFLKEHYRFDPETGDNPGEGKKPSSNS